MRVYVARRLDNGRHVLAVTAGRLPDPALPLWWHDGVPLECVHVWDTSGREAAARAAELTYTIRRALHTSCVSRTDSSAWYDCPGEALVAAAELAPPELFRTFRRRPRYRWTV